MIPLPFLGLSLLSRCLQVISPRTKAIIVTHIYGQAADLDPISEIRVQRKAMISLPPCSLRFASSSLPFVR